MISFDVNNGGKLTIEQNEHDKSMIVKHGNETQDTISSGDFVMLLNLFFYIKQNDIQNDFINPHGKNRE